MGNAELRLTLQEIHTEVAETKGIAMETRQLQTVANGKTASLSKWREQMVGGFKVAIPFLTLLAGGLSWLVVDYLNHRDKPAQIDSVQFQAALDQAFRDNYEITK